MGVVVMVGREFFRPGQQVDVIVAAETWRRGIVVAGFEYGYLVKLDDDQRPTWHDAVKVRARRVLPCGCLENKVGAHRVGCPDYPQGRRPWRGE
jgi:hypothetical protein